MDSGYLERGDTSKPGSRTDFDERGAHARRTRSTGRLLLQRPIRRETEHGSLGYNKIHESEWLILVDGQFGGLARECTI